MVDLEVGHELIADEDNILLWKLQYSNFGFSIGDVMMADYVDHVLSTIVDDAEVYYGINDLHKLFF